MAANLIHKYVWLVNTIHRARLISLEDINREWLESDIGDGKPLPRRTFHVWQAAILDIFGLIIENENKGQYRYYIANEEELRLGTMSNWLLDSLTVSGMLASSRHIQNRILLEQVPSARDYLGVVVEAMRHNYKIVLTYQTYSQTEPKVRTVMPFCLKIFKQRWYMLAQREDKEKPSIYSLDRVKDMQLLRKETFVLPKNFDAESYFAPYYGIIADESVERAKVKLRVSPLQAKYLRALPLHHSQQEMAEEAEACVFSYNLRPAFDFVQEILSHGSEMEVLKPLWLREKIAAIIKEENNIYNG
ncbi:MAG: WYL domain-containing protein [Bacteroidales bacterium]|nr:WYL domain-containing protein [Bacteroidales bacterium]